MADDISEASVLALGISYAMVTLREIDSGRMAEWVSTYKPEAERLSRLLEQSKIGGELSLANPYPVDVAGFAWESHAAAVAKIVSDGRIDLAEKFTSFTWMGCAKEYERATDKPCNVEIAGGSKSRNAERDKWVIEQFEQGIKYREIREGAKKKNPEWEYLSTDQSVLAVLKRRGLK
jgi:hypothetical protein